MRFHTCSADSDGCSHLATCTNTVGAYRCDCMAGYSGNGMACSDVDECAVANGGCDALTIAVNAAPAVSYTVRGEFG